MNGLFRIKSDNKGATMVIVLITIAFITILGAILLFTSYTGYKIKASQAVGENRFYDAETAMDEIRAGLQSLVSDSISRAYTDLMTEYDGISDIDDKFINMFTEDFLSDDPSSPGSGLFIFSDPSKTIEDFLPAFPAAITVQSYAGYLADVSFNLLVLNNLFTAGSGTDTITLTLNPSAITNNIFIEGEWIPDSAIPLGGKFVVNNVIIKGLRITHETEDGYLSIVDTDIAIQIPSMTSIRSLLSFRIIADFALISTDILDSPAASSNVNIDGNVYAGGVELVGGAGNTGTVTLRKGMLISGGDGIGSNPNGDITVINRGLVSTPGTTVWAQDLRIGRTTATDTMTGSVTLQGTTNVAGSLILNGTRTVYHPVYDDDGNLVEDDDGNPVTTTSTAGSSAILSGQYNGFGTGRLPSDPDTVPPVSELSSSIVVNGRHSELNLSGLNRLFLAGQSFIETAGTTNPLTGVTYGHDILTGQSMAVRSDQLAYLVPPALISNMNSNPVFFNNINDVPAADLIPDINYSAPLWPGSDRTLGHYANPGSYHRIFYPMPGASEQVVMFVFIQFRDVPGANNYFIDYFQNNATEIRNYLDIYLDFYTAAAGTVQTSGATYIGSNPGGPVGIIPNQAGFITSDRYFEEYANRRRTLTKDYMTFNNPAPPLQENPFHYVVLEQPPAGIYSFEGRETAYVHHGPGAITLTQINAMLTPNNTINDIKLIISYGDVTVDMAYDGLIICEGKIHLNNSVSATLSSHLRTALLAEHPFEPTAGKRLGHYLNIDISGAGDNKKGETWDFTQLVYFDNWKKN